MIPQGYATQRARSSFEVGRWSWSCASEQSLPPVPCGRGRGAGSTKVDASRRAAMDHMAAAAEEPGLGRSGHGQSSFLRAREIRRALLRPTGGVCGARIDAPPIQRWSPTGASSHTPISIVDEAGRRRCEESSCQPLLSIGLTGDRVSIAGVI